MQRIVCLKVLLFSLKKKYRSFMIRYVQILAICMVTLKFSDLKEWMPAKSYNNIIYQIIQTWDSVYRLKMTKMINKKIRLFKQTQTWPCIKIQKISKKIEGFMILIWYLNLFWTLTLLILILFTVTFCHIKSLSLYRLNSLTQEQLKKLVQSINQ